MQAAGNLISPAAEFSAGVQHGQAHFNGRPSHLGMQSHRKAAAVVHHRYAAVSVQCDVDLSAVSGKCFVHRVVNYFIYQVMQAPGIR